MDSLTTLLLKLPRNTDVTPEAAQTFLSAVTKINFRNPGFLKIGASPAKAFALEIVLENQQVHFQLTCHPDLVPFIKTQIHSNYPLATIEKIDDPIAKFKDILTVSYLKLKQGNYYPLANYTAFTDIDPLSSILSVLSKASPEDTAVVQYSIESTSEKWQEDGKAYAEHGTKNEDGTYSPRPDANIIKEKIAYPGFQTSIRLAAKNANTIQELVNSFGVFTRPDSNAFTATFVSGNKHKKEVDYLLSRRVADKQILNIQELASLWHLPSEKIKTPSILWGTNVLSEPPSNLPIALDKTPAEKTRINFFAKTVFKNRETVFGIKDADRLRHVWCVGKTGTGKSTMIANMAIDDLKKDRGLAVIDPHGDLCEDLLNYIPSSRINDTIYFNPADKDFPIIINPLEVTNKEEAELVVAGLMSIFTKVWSNVWSARMEYILRNAFMTLTEIPGSTLEDVLKLLAVQSYRNKIVSRLKDDTLIHFWKDEFDAMPEKLQKEAISPIQNKVGQFVTSPMIRRIIGNPKSSISIDQIMDEKKILLVNLSQGRLGEDNAALLGAMIITKFQLSAMHRVDTDKEKRVPFHLYVDEFQNFATDSFIKILSEARKYGLALLLANQYMAQIPEQITKAILGNVGSIITFSVGADDASILHKEFAEVFSEADLVNLINFQIAIKLMIDGHSTRPFLATTLPLPESNNMNREKVIKVSRERWAKTVKEDEESNSDGTNNSGGTGENTNQPAIQANPLPSNHNNNQNRQSPTKKKRKKAKSNKDIYKSDDRQNPNTGNKQFGSNQNLASEPISPKPVTNTNPFIPQNQNAGTNNQTQYYNQIPNYPSPPANMQFPQGPNIPMNKPGYRTLQGEKDLLDRNMEIGENKPQKFVPPVQQNNSTYPMPSYPQDIPSQYPNRPLTRPVVQPGFPQKFPNMGTSRSQNSTQMPAGLPQQFPRFQPQTRPSYPPLPNQPGNRPMYPNQAGTYPSYPRMPQYPPPRPAFDEEKAKREAEEQKRKEDTRLSELKDELAKLEK